MNHVNVLGKHGAVGKMGMHMWCIYPCVMNPPKSETLTKMQPRLFLYLSQTFM